MDRTNHGKMLICMYFNDPERGVEGVREGTVQRSSSLVMKGAIDGLHFTPFSLY